MVAAEAAAAGSPPLVARHSGLAEVARGPGGRLSGRVAAPGELRDGRFGGPGRKAPRAACAHPRGPSGPRRRPARRVAVERWSWSSVAASACYRFIYASDVGDSQRLSPDEQISSAREAFDEGQDFTIAVEEEFALLDPDTLELTNRFEELKAGAGGNRARRAPRRRADRFGDRGEDGAVRKLRGSGRADRASAARSSASSPTEFGVGLSSTGTHPWSRWQDQRIIDTPHYRRNNEILQYVVWRNNSFGIHAHIGIRGADRAIAVCNAFRNVLPELLALSASSPFVEDCVTGLHSARTEIFTKTLPALRRSGRLRRLGRLRGVRPLPLRDRVDRRAHADLVERPPASRVSDRRGAHLRRAAGPRRGPVARQR